MTVAVSFAMTSTILTRQGRLISLFMLLAGVSCSDDDALNADQHKVFFVGFVYDGATGVRLKPDQITAISVKYRDKVVRTTLEADGRYVTVDPLPTWQDYSVYIGAAGYRPFVSRNAGIDVPRSLSMTEALASTGTTQTFHFDAYLFPIALKAAKVNINIEKADAATAMPAPARADGTIRLRPESSSVLERTPLDLTGGTTTSPVRRWANDEDLLNQTITRPFSEGKLEVAEGELAYGVPYQIAVFDVKGYQPVVFSGSTALVAGVTTSRSVTLPKELREPLRVLATNSDVCTLPAATSADYGATIQITFNEEPEFVGTNYAEDIDNGVVVTPSSSTSSTFCPLKTSVDPTKQERGTRVALQGNILTLSFSPGVGFATVSSFGTTCTLPPALTSVVYGNLAAVNLQPKGDSSRKRTLAAMVFELMQSGGSGTISCPARPTGSF